MAAYEIPGLSFSLPAAADFSTGAGQFRFVNVNSSGQATTPAAGGEAIGVRQNKPRQLEATTIVATGIVMVEASAAILLGANVSATATGLAVTTATTNAILGVAVTAAGGNGELLSVLLQAVHPKAP